MKALRTKTTPEHCLPQMHDGMFVVVAAAAVRPVLVLVWLKSDVTCITKE